jgi:hypothetical protein
MHGPGDKPRHVSSSRGPCEGCLHQRALRVTHGPSWSSLTCCRRAVVSTFWGPPLGPLLPSFLSSLLLATWGFSSSCSMAVSSGAAAAGPGQDPISAHAAHLNLPSSASPPSADHPCGSAPLMAWPRGGHSPGLDPGFVHSSFSCAFSSSPSSLSPAALNCSRLFSGPSLRVSINLASWGA